ARQFHAFHAGAFPGFAACATPLRYPHALWTNMRTVAVESGFTPYATRPAQVWLNFSQSPKPAKIATA
ncbi:hypothetical protein KJE23_09655, partial [Streptococcus salivarius]|nr:hypothetical protein [Streptococcus salivarius]